MKSSKKDRKSQLGLVDKSEHGKLYPWQVYRKTSLILSQAIAANRDEYARNEVARTEACASSLSFKECIQDKTHPKKLTQANFCRNRLCVGCQMRRSLKCFSTTVKIVHYLQHEHKDLQFIFLTLTVPNAPIDELGKTVQHMFDSWTKLTKRRGVKKIMQGYLRCMEITYNHQRDDYHPHFHALIAVKKSFFTGKNYIKRDKWLEMWRESTKQPEITQVDVRKVKANTDEEVLKACGEIAKYSTKTWSTSSKQSNRKFLGKLDELDYGVEGHLWIRKTPEETADIALQLSQILKGRRLLQYGGLMRDAKKHLNVKDGEDEGADLIHTTEKETGCTCPICKSDLVETQYLWSKAIGDYRAGRSKGISEIEENSILDRKTLARRKAKIEGQEFAASLKKSQETKL